MQSYLLQPKDIKKITGEAFYSRGKQYFESGKVYGLSHNSAIHSWRAVVAGTHDYEVRVFFFEDDDVEATCECAAYSTYYTCKHIAAVLIAIRERALEELAPKLADKGRSRSPRTTSQDRMFAVSLFEAFRQKQESRTGMDTKKPLRIQYSLHIQSILGARSLGIELKLGEKYPYVIKNIRELLEYIRKQQPYRLTKSFTYDPAEHTFSEEDQAIFQLLQRAYEQEQFFEQQWNTAEQKILKISPALVHQLLPLLEKQEAEVIERGSQAGLLHYEESFPDLTFYVSEERGHFHMHMNHLKDYDYLSDYHLLYKEGSFYPVAQEKEEVIRTLYSILPYNSNGSHTISHNDMEGIVSYVLPELETIADVNLDTSAQQKINQEDLRAEVYLDFQQWTLTIDVKFHYGDLVIDPFNDKERPGQTIVQRDFETEQNIMQIIESAEFKFDGEMVYLEDEDSLETFLYQYLPSLKDYSDVFLSGAVRSLFDDQQHELQASIDLESDGSWLDISFAIEGISTDDVTEALKAVIERKKYYRLSDGALMSLTSDSFERFQRLVEDLNLTAGDVEDNHFQVAAARSLQVDEALDTNLADRSNRYEELVTRLRSPQSFEIDPPENLQADLRSYQLTGFRWMKMLSHYGLGGVLADDMGLGKTLQTISYILDEKQEGSLTAPAVIVAPASLVYNWKKELEKFAPSLTVQVMTGDPSERQAAFEQAEGKDVWITSYPLLRQDIKQYEDKDFHVMVLDESQAIKNESTKTASSVRSLRARHRFALSGTPIENSLQELWSLFRAIMPGFFTSKKKFTQLKPAKISQMTRPFILRRMKTEVLDELPDKIDSVQYSELTREQKEVYLAYLERIQNDIQETIATKGIQRGKLEILAGLTRLRQICCHPALFLENYEGQSGKLEQLKELAEEMKAGGHRMLIFSQFSSMLTLMHKELTDNGLDAFYLDGSTKSEKRMEMVEAFNNGEKDAFFISLKAGGTGLNLTGADTVILYDLWWNPAIEEQAAGRAHRIGQEKVVQVIRMISEGTIEERIYQLQQKKRDLVDQIIQPGESMLTSLSEEEIQQLFQ
ncbi:SNF2 helicase associated domain-containing protein [Halobacillus kuroshimensis]|uniref:SNF2 helicase associated domain-containing protein n=1 Tax=Halobacillus kuroshimensis TaxID=302481 RepID=A0ABS3DVM5_9BACI|nr:DEAD/DEAH box helicase [Halobacillus kuroshimensis]MBN8235376.1 SNF2 helicase associated domain-containing protein [Halobacillus kuroshimensis]